MLAMSLFLAVLDQPSALFVFWDIHGTGEGHAMAAISLGAVKPHPPFDLQDNLRGWYTPAGVTYYACETTALGWAVGEMPPLLSDIPPDRIIEIHPRLM